MKTLKLRNFSDFATAIPQVPVLVQEYLDAADIVTGSSFKLVKDGKSENTGDGMSYYDRLQVFCGDKTTPIFNSGFQLWRPGHAFSTNRPDMEINGVKLVREEGDAVIYGYKDGRNKVFIMRSRKDSSNECLISFSLEAYHKAIKSKDEPKGKSEFEAWVGRQLPEIGGSSWHYDVYHDDDVCSVVIARHCSRSVDASHDAFMVFVWKKGVGVAASSINYTGAKSTTSKFSTNYLRGKVTVADNGDIIYKATSERGDVSIDELFVIQ